MDKSQKNLLATSLLVSIVLIGLMLVIRSLKPAKLRLLLQLKKK